jgi:hypothetical protein
MTFAYFVDLQHNALRQVGLQYLLVRYGGALITDAVLYDMGTSNETEASGASPFTGSEFLQTFGVCLQRPSFDNFCALNGFDADYATAANMDGWDISKDNGATYEQMKVLGDRTVSVVEYYVKLVTLGQY